MVIQTEYTPDLTSVSYVPSDVTGHAGQVANIFWPNSTVYPRTTGRKFPVCFYSNLSAFTTVSLITSITATAPNDAFILHQWLEAGGMVINLSLTKANDSAHAGVGKGFFHPIGSALGNYEDKTKPMAVKDWIYAIQFFRYNASTYFVDKNAMGCRCFSAAAMTAMWCILGPDRKSAASAPGLLTPTPNGSLGSGGQYDESTLLQFAVLGGCTFDWLSMTDATTGLMFPDLVTDPTGETGAATQANADTAYRTAFSPLTYAPADAYSRRLYLVSTTNNVSSAFQKPYATNSEAVHSAYGNFVWMSRAAKTRVRHAINSTVTNPSDLTLVNVDTGNTGLPDLKANADANGMDMLNWMLRSVGYEQMVDPNPQRGGAATPMSVMHKGEAAWGSGTVDTTGSVLFPYNPLRRLGVFIQNTGATNDLKVGPDADRATMVLEQRGSTVGINSHFFEGQGALFGKSNTSTTTWSGYEI